MQARQINWARAQVLQLFHAGACIVHANTPRVGAEIGLACLPALVAPQRHRAGLETFPGKMVDIGGLGLSVLAAVCNGSFGMFQKLKSVEQAQVCLSVALVCGQNLDSGALSCRRASAVALRLGVPNSCSSWRLFSKAQLLTRSTVCGRSRRQTLICGCAAVLFCQVFHSWLWSHGCAWLLYHQFKCSSRAFEQALCAQVFTPYGLISGAFFVLSMACTLFAIQRLGLSSAAGIWCGTASVVSFTFAVKASRSNVFSQQVKWSPCVVHAGFYKCVLMHEQITRAGCWALCLLFRRIGCTS